jgi:hypothetical protein
VDDALVVGGGEARRDLRSDLDRAARRQDPLEEACPQGLALQELRDQVGRAFVGPDVVNHEDVRVVERPGGPRLLLEAQETFLVAGERGGQDLDRHFSSEAGVAGTVNLAHPAHGQGRGDLVRPEALARGETSRGRGLGVQPALLLLRDLTVRSVKVSARRRGGKRPGAG